MEPGAAVKRALAAEPRPTQPIHLLALGKAAPAMARAAVDWLAAHDIEPAGGLVVAPRAARVASSESAVRAERLPAAFGDHPVPGPASLSAATALGRAAGAVGPGDRVILLLSGGTSSLVAAPVPGVSGTDLDQLWRMLLASGVDIHVMNAVRRRFTRWGGGRLAMALEGRRIDVLAVSDVPGDDPGSIGSGPCAPDPLSLAEVEALIDQAGLLGLLPPTIARRLRHSEAQLPTAPPGHPALAGVRTRIIASNHDAVRAAAECALSLGAAVRILPEQLLGEAADAGAHAAEQLRTAAPSSPAALTCILAGGETAVTLSGGTAARYADASPPGGRCQELALAAARVLAGDGAGERIALLAAGTDGRDGPTDAAGAIVDGLTWQRIGAAGYDPAAALARHDSYRALDAAGALFRTGPTGTNVMDVVIGLRSGTGAGVRDERGRSE